MGFHPLKALAGKLNLKNNAEIEALLNTELEYWWQEVVKHLGWQDLNPRRLEKRKSGFYKASYHPLKMKVYAMNDAQAVAEYLAKKREENLRTVKQKMTAMGESLKQKVRGY